MSALSPTPAVRDGGAARTRGRALRRAGLSGLAARGAGALVQLVSLPIAAAALGNQGFVLYGSAMALLGWLMLSQLGVGPALSVAIADARGRGDDEVVERAFATAWGLSLAITLVLAALGAVVLAAGPLLGGVGEALLGAGGPPGAVRSVALFVVALFLVSGLLAPIEHAQLGFQQRDDFNRWALVGSLGAAAGIVVAALLDPRPLTVLAAAQIPPLAARAINAARFLRRSALPLAPLLDRPLARRLLAQGLSFTSAGSVAHFLLHAFPILLAARSLGAASAAEVVATMNLVVVLASVFQLTAMPLMAAAGDAAGRGEQAWVRATWARLALMNFGFGLAVAALLWAAGPQIFLRWYGGTIVPSPVALGWAGIYLALLGLEVVSHAALAGLGQVHRAARFMAARGLLVGIALVVVPAWRAPAPLFALLALSALLLTALPLGWRAARAGANR